MITDKKNAMKHFNTTRAWFSIGFDQIDYVEIRRFLSINFSFMSNNEMKVHRFSWFEDENRMSRQTFWVWPPSFLLHQNIFHWFLISIRDIFIFCLLTWAHPRGRPLNVWNVNQILWKTVFRHQTSRRLSERNFSSRFCSIFFSFATEIIVKENSVKAKGYVVSMYVYTQQTIKKITIQT